MSGHSQIKGDLVWYRLARAGVDGNARALFLFLLAPPGERPYAGLRRYLPTEPLSFMPDWTPDTAQKALSALQEADLVRYDPEACLVFVPLLLECQPCRGASSVSGAIGGIEDYPDSPLLAGPLAHLAEGAREAALAARERAETLKDSKKRETAIRSAEQMEAIAQGLEERLERVRRNIAPLEAAPEANTPPCAGASTPPTDIPEAPSRGGNASQSDLTPPLEGGCAIPPGLRKAPSRGGSESQNDPIPPLEGGCALPQGSPEAPSTGGSRARGRACAPHPHPHPHPDPSGEDPPKRAPPSRGGPPESVGGVLDRIGDRGGR